MKKKIKSILLVILFVLCVGLMFAGCDQKTTNKYRCKDNEELKVQTFIGYAGSTTADDLSDYVNKWIEVCNKDIEVIDIQVTGISNSQYYPSTVIMVVYKELNGESK